MVTLLPFKVPAPAKFTVPVPRVKVPLLVNVPAADMFNVPAADQLKVPVPLFVKVVVVIEPVAPKVTTPLLVTEVDAVMAPAKLLTFRVTPVLTVIVAGGVAMAVAILRSWAMVVVAPVGGTPLPNHEAAVAQSVAPVVVI